MTTEQNIANIFESGQYELALTLAESQGIDIVNLPVDFHNIVTRNFVDFCFHAFFGIGKYKLSIAAGNGIRSKRNKDGKFYLFEIAILPHYSCSNNDILDELKHLFNVKFHSVTDTYSNDFLQFDYQSNNDILKIIKKLTHAEL
jgi:hypothetical protein